MIVVLGFAGLIAATSLTVGALALAGDEIGSVVRPKTTTDPSLGRRGDTGEDLGARRYSPPPVRSAGKRVRSPLAST